MQKYQIGGSSGFRSAVFGGIRSERQGAGTKLEGKSFDESEIWAAKLSTEFNPAIFWWEITPFEEEWKPEWPEKIEVKKGNADFVINFER